MMAGQTDIVLAAGIPFDLQLVSIPSSLVAAASGNDVPMIEVLCTVVGVIAGVAIVGSLISKREPATSCVIGPTQASGRIKEISNQLQLISARVAANVSAHSDKVEHISERLEDADMEANLVIRAIEEILEANHAMQAELADAQKRIAEQSEMIGKATHQARTDALTGLANRRALDDYLKDLLEFIDEAKTIGVMLLDIDHFKSFNDNFGHITGDAVLSVFAESISDRCGPDAYAARYGGEEFAIVLTAASTEQLVLRATRLRHEISEQVVNYEDLRLKVTASAGVCCVQSDDTLNSAYARADEGLRHAKQAGRDRGYWLGEEGWQPFPDVASRGAKDLPTVGTTVQEVEREAVSQSHFLVSETTVDGRDHEIEVNEIEVNEIEDNEIEDNLPAVESESLRAEDTEQKPADDEISGPIQSPAADSTLQDDPAGDETSADRSAREEESRESSEILDLSPFLEQLDRSFQQLQRAEMPGMGLMIEAVGWSGDEQARLRSWEDRIVPLIRLNLRSLDLICQYRPNTLCVFMPGCLQKVALRRASSMQNKLIESRKIWKTESVPERFTIAAATLEQREKSSEFLNRLESALEDAQDAEPLQVVLNDGESSWTCPLESLAQNSSFLTLTPEPHSS